MSFDYALAPETLAPLRRTAFDALCSARGGCGRAISTFLYAGGAGGGIAPCGISSHRATGYEQLNERYFKERADGLRLSPVGLGKLVTAWV